MRRFFLAFLMFVCVSPGASAAERVALVIASSGAAGGTTFEEATLSADAVVESLEAAGYRATLALDYSRSDLARALSAFSYRLEEPGSIGVLYFAGPGCSVGGANYVVAHDTRLADAAAIAATALPLDTLLGVTDAEQAVAALFLDVFPAGGACTGALTQPSLASGSLMLSAAPGKVPVPPGGRPTLFAESLAESLGQPGITLQEVIAIVAARVAAETDGAQQPWAVNRLAALRLHPPAGAPESGSTGGGGSGGMSGGVPDFDAGDAVASEGGHGGGGLSVEEEEALRREYEELKLREEQARAEQAERDAAGSREEESGIATGGKPPGAVLGRDGGPGPVPAGVPVQPRSVSMAEFLQAYTEALSEGGDVVAALSRRLPAGVPLDAAAQQMLASVLELHRGGGVDAAPEPVDRAAAPDPDMASTAPPPPPPPPPRETVAPAAETVARHPTMDADDEVIAGETVTVTIALTEERLTPEVTVEAAPGVALDAAGALNLPLPAAQDEWPIDVDLFAPGFELADGGRWTRRVTLYRSGDSDPARFELKARRIATDSKPRQFMARFYHAGQFLGSASRPVTVFRDAEALAAAEAPPPGEIGQAETMLAGDVTLGSGLEVPDLDVTIHYDDPDTLGRGLVVIHSPHIAGPVTEEFETPPEMAEWLDSRYRELVEAGLRVRGAKAIGTAAAAPDNEARKRFAMKMAEGFGDELYEHYVPTAFKEVFWSLRNAGKLRSIQVTSNSPLMPWEIIRPQAANGDNAGFLGLNFRMARWTPRAAGRQIDRPLAQLAFTGVATVAPAYDGSNELPFQQIEVDALSKLDGFRKVGGDFLSFERMVGEVSSGFVHFSGHGEVSDPGTGAPVFAIRLVDLSLDPGTWAALDFAPPDKGNPFYFFNACDTGRARSLGGFVQGWGPAVLSSGASGFIGGMWPLADRAAAAFSSSFYGEISGRLPSGPVYVADVLSEVRRKFYDTGDPTYLAYTFYGNANLQVVSR